MINGVEYVKAKQRGLVGLAIQDDQAQVSFARFDPATGDRVDDFVVTVTRDQIVNYRAKLKAEWDALGVFVADLQALLEG